MQRASAFRAIILLLLSAAAAAGCRTVEKHPDETPPRNVDTVGQADAFHAEVPIGATLDTVLAADLDGPGKLEYIVTSRDTSVPAGAVGSGRTNVRAWWMRDFTVPSGRSSSRAISL